MMEKRLQLNATFFLLLLSFGPHDGRAQETSDTLEVHFINVGQADAALIRCPDGENFMLIDAADNRYPGSVAAFRGYIERQFQGRAKPWRLRTVVASHPHADHIASMKWVLENFDVGTYVDNGQKYDSATFSRLNAFRRKQVDAGKLLYIDGRDEPFAELDPCEDENVTAQIIVPWAEHSLSDTNDRSVVVRLDFGNTSFLFVGDAEKHAEEVMLNELDEEHRKLLDVDVLKVGHHGSDTSSTAEFVSAVSPQIAIVSSGVKDVGTNKRYKHPRLSTMQTYADWLKNLDSEAHPLDGLVHAYQKSKERWQQHKRRQGVWVTPKDGTVIVRSDGTNLDISLPNDD